MDEMYIFFGVYLQETISRLELMTIFSYRSLLELQCIQHKMSVSFTKVNVVHNACLISIIDDQVILSRITMIGTNETG